MFSWFLDAPCNRSLQCGWIGSLFASLLRSRQPPKVIYYRLLTNDAFNCLLSSPASRSLSKQLYKRLTKNLICWHYLRLFMVLVNNMTSRNWRGDHVPTLQRPWMTNEITASQLLLRSRHLAKICDVIIMNMLCSNSCQNTHKSYYVGIYSM